MTTTKVGTLAALLGVAFAIGGRPCAAETLTPLQAYDKIKLEESNFPLPQPRAEVNVGTFDAATARFTGLTTETETFTDSRNKPVTITTPPVAFVNAVAVTLRFAAKNGPAMFTVTPTFGS